MYTCVCLPERGFMSATTGVHLRIQREQGEEGMMGDRVVIMQTLHNTLHRYRQHAAVLYRSSQGSSSRS